MKQNFIHDFWMKTEYSGKSFISNVFTLVELLIVISIITILTCLLLPALTKSKGYAKTVQCLSNQKQCAVAAYNYASDSQGGYLPHSENNYYGSGEDITVGSVLSELEYVKEGLFLCPSTTTNYYEYSSLPAKRIRSLIFIYENTSTASMLATETVWWKLNIPGIEQ